MNLFDIILACFLLFGVINGFRKGLFIEITSLLGLVLGVYGAIHFSYFLAEILKGSVGWEPSMIQLVAFAGTFIIILLSLVLLGKALTKIAETIALGPFNKILGAIFSGVKYALIASVILLVFDQFNNTIKFVDVVKVEESRLYEPVKNFAPTIFPKMVKVIDKRSEK